MNWCIRITVLTIPSRPVCLRSTLPHTMTMLLVIARHPAIWVIIAYYLTFRSVTHLCFSYNWCWVDRASIPQYMLSLTGPWCFQLYLLHDVFCPYVSDMFSTSNVLLFYFHLEIFLFLLFNSPAAGMHSHHKSMPTPRLPLLASILLSPATP